MDVVTFINKLGGPTALARELDVPFTTVAAWRQRGKIPHWRVDKLIEVARAKKVPVPEIFFTREGA